MIKVIWQTLLLLFLPNFSWAEWCDPPVAPTLTTPEMAKEFREEFKTEFNQYFRDASLYVTCLDAERVRIFAEMENTALRYHRFLRDAEGWAE